MKGVSGAPAGRLGRSPLACWTQQSAVGDVCQHGCDVLAVLAAKAEGDGLFSTQALGALDTALDLLQQGRVLAACLIPISIFDLRPDPSRYRGRPLIAVLSKETAEKGEVER